jgi:alpha-L-fucosidase-like protein
LAVLVIASAQYSLAQTQTRNSTGAPAQGEAEESKQGAAEDANVSHRADWMRQARWGVMTHFLAEWINPQAHSSAAAWNAMVDGFDVEGLAEQIKSTGAGYYLVTIGQNSGFYDAPNAAYDKFVGIQPSHCSKRDLIADLYTALNKRGIKLMVYLPAGAPGRDAVARKMLEWQAGPHRNREFQIKWEQVIREWSLRWGKKVSGWWFDGVYWPNAMYRGDSPNFSSFAAAVRAGNPDAVIAFNPGVLDRTLSLTPYEDYTAGETNDLDRVSIRRVQDGRADGAQIHRLIFLGQTWGKGPPRFSNEQVTGFTQNFIVQGGVVTWDVPIQPNGLISKPFMEQLTAIGKAVAQQKLPAPNR